MRDRVEYRKCRVCLGVFTVPLRGARRPPAVAKTLCPTCVLALRRARTAVRSGNGTLSPPGQEERIAALAERAWAGLPLFPVRRTRA
jgi:hypothetical protein